MRAVKTKEWAYLHRICKQNGYPRDFIQRCCKRHGHRTIHNRPIITTWATLPYINGVSEATAWILAPDNVNVAHKPNQTLHTKVMRPKDPLPKDDRSSIVYKINCNGCHCNYIGETAKRLKTRIQEHELAVKRHEQHSQVWAHMADNNHIFNFAGAEVIAQDSMKAGRLFKEAWLSGQYSVNRYIELLPAYQKLRECEQ